MNKIEKIFSNILPFIPLLLITGPFLSDLTVSISSVFFLIIYFKTQNLKKIELNFYTIIFFLFWILMIVSSALSEFKFYSLKVSFTYLRFILFIFFLNYLINLGKIKFFKQTLFILSTCFIILFIDTVIQFINGYNIFGLKANYPRMSSFFGDELILGSYISRLFPLLIALFMFFRPKDNGFIENLVLFILTIFAFLTILLSGERVATFNFCLSIFLIIILFNNYFRFKILIIFFIPVIIVSILFTENIIKKRIINDTILDITYKKPPLEFRIFSLAHESHFKSSIKMFIENPIIGIGPKNFRNLCSNKEYYINELSCTTHPHNTYIQILTETGILGFLIIFLFLSILILKLVLHFFSKFFNNKYHLSNFNLSIIIGLLLFVFPLIPSGNFFNNWLNIIFFFQLGIYLSNSKIKT